MTHYEFHEYANIFPILEGDELEALRADIAENGQINKIILYQGKILDGRNRYIVCEMLGIEPETIEYIDDDPLGLVLSQNLRRRHLDASQRAMVAGNLANLAYGGDRRSEKFQVANLQIEKPDPISWKVSSEEIEQQKRGIPETVSQSEAAEKLNVSPRSVADATKVLKNAVPEVIEAVESGKLAVSAAATLVEKSPEQQRETLAKCEKEGSGRLGKDGKLRPAKYKPRKKTVAKTEDSEEQVEYLKIPLPIDHSTMTPIFGRRFQNESEEVKDHLLRELAQFIELIQNIHCD
jgi:ParB-like chromosome segregation protein Spo0J